MKYLLLCLFSGMAVFLLIQIIRVDLSHPDEYDWGYLTGKGILLVLFTGLSIITWRHIRK